MSADDNWLEVVCPIFLTKTILSKVTKYNQREKKMPHIRYT